MCRCITCKVGLHAECYEWYDIKPLHKLKTDMYICIPCMTLATQRVPGVEKEEEDEGEDEEGKITRIIYSFIIIISIFIT